MEEMNGFGEGSVAELQELRKALSIGYQDPPATGGDALRVESLEATLKVLSYGATHIKLWNDIPKMEAYSTVEEYSRLNAYGQDSGGFVDGGVLPEAEDSDYSRETQKVKYVGTTRAVDHPATLVRSVPSDLIAQETANGVLWMLGKIERGLFFGDSTLVPQEWDGVNKQIIDGGGTVIDLRGAPLDAGTIEEASDIIAQNYGVASKLYANNTVFSDFSKTYYGQQRWSSPNAPAGKVGTPVTGMSTQAGDVEFSSNVFLKKGALAPTSATSPKAPTAPTLAVGVPGASGTSQFIAADAGNYKWSVTAVNQFGESVPSALSASTAIAAGEGVTLTVTDGGGTYPATAYKIYRTDKTAADATAAYMTTVTATAGQAGVEDENADIPGSFSGNLLDLSSQSLSFKQLSPLIRMPLAMLAPSIRWMQLLYGTPIVYAPKRHVVFKNIGQA